MAAYGDPGAERPQRGSMGFGRPRPQRPMQPRGGGLGGGVLRRGLGAFIGRRGPNAPAAPGQGRPQFPAEGIQRGLEAFRGANPSAGMQPGGNMPQPAPPPAPALAPWEDFFGQGAGQGSPGPGNIGMPGGNMAAPSLPTLPPPNEGIGSFKPQRPSFGGGRDGFMTNFGGGYLG